MLKQALLKGLNLFSPIIPLPWLQALSGQRLLSVFYHTISDKPLPHIQHLYAIRGSLLFRADLDYITKYYTPVSLEQLIDFIYHDKALPKNAFFLTFDDGLSECFHVIAPILKEKGIPATFFLNSDFIDNQGLMFRYKASYLIEKIPNTAQNTFIVQQYLSKYSLKSLNIKEGLLSVRWQQQQVLEEIALHFDIDFNHFLQEQQPYLTSNQIQAMVADGFTFGSHSQNHPIYNKLSLEEQIEQTVACQGFINERFSLSYQAFAFPFTDVGVSKAFFEEILEKQQFQLTFGGAGLKKELIKGHLQRMGFETAVNRPIQQLIHTEYCYYLLKALVGKNTIRR